MRIVAAAALYSLGHGGNDAQKTMGIITVVLASGGLFNLKLGAQGALPQIPLYVVLIAHAAIALGTLSGGWRIVHTMGSKITKLRPVGGFSAETAGAATLFAVSGFVSAREAVVHKRVEVAVGHGIHAATLAAITAVGSAKGNELLAPEAHATVTTVAGDHVDVGFIYELHDLLACP